MVISIRKLAPVVPVYLLAGQIRHVDESVVEGGEDVSHTEAQLALTQLSVQEQSGEKKVVRTR